MLSISNHQPIKSLILDMDGVLWRENAPIGDLAAVFDGFSRAGLKVMLATNNATRTPAQYLQKIAGFGAQLEEAQVVNSSMGVAYLLKKRFPEGGPVYILGEIGLTTALNAAGFYHSEEPGLAVIGSMDRDITFWKLKAATLLIRRGIPFYFTNPDRTFPTPEGIIPGAGAILAALETATDVSPIIAGKPGTTLFDFALERLGTLPQETLVVGDRLETDILGGQRAGCKTALVLSGISTQEEANAWQPYPDLVINELSDLLKALDEH
ncbi:MAG: haloacid dehalogenase [Chloroflexi bacterium HGW-Chloroflexi-4]|jgi:4-nitrophenyl phosphatase|nr:MAG: haloacid dehalogenase [Chloroflexi bacterium HGW-Chloroflexi-4]